MRFTLEAIKVCMECLRPTRSYIPTTFRCWFRREPLWAEAVAGAEPARPLLYSLGERRSPYVGLTSIKDKPPK